MFHCSKCQQDFNTKHQSKTHTCHSIKALIKASSTLNNTQPTTTSTKTKANSQPTLTTPSITDTSLINLRAPSTTPTLSEVQEDDSSEHILNLNQLVISDGDEDINGEQGNSTLQSLQQSPDSGLWENDLLRSLNLAINTDLRIFVCRLCEKGFINKKPGCIVKHMRKHTSITQDIVAGLRKLADQFKINDFPNLASTNPPTLRQQKGFTILYMFGCPICPTAGTRKFMNDHFRESHPHIYPAATPVPNIPCHAFTFGKPRHYVRIIPDTVTAPPTTEDTITTALSNFRSETKLRTRFQMLG
ncbi:hypothetical protein CC2G_006665 [Coprinopsis cinerea AmutBmut pab1-1]|nr:hypothetical protein CC2G_006665 [Coprinopsis cinerea AmutBmut pab1-1]